MTIFKNKEEKFVDILRRKNEIKKHTIMVVDDEVGILKTLGPLFSSDYNVITAGDGQQALQVIQKMEHPENISVIISDQKMPGLTGVKFFEQVKKIIPDTFRIILTAYDEKPIIIDSINKAEIHEFILKPVEPEDLKHRVRQAIEKFELKKERDEYRRQLEQQVNRAEKEKDRLRESFFSEGLKNRALFENIKTKNKKMENIFKYIEAIAYSDEPVLITGETGTGKELIARAIHQLYNSSNEKKGEFVADNVAGWDEALFSDTLFGHEKGSFTGAVNKRAGLLEQAKDGTIFLDEIGDLPLPLQTRLLRIIQERKFFPIGSDKPQENNARFILATNKDLNAMKDTGEFRKDLFFRLNTHSIHLPPLRERKEDIPILVEYFIEDLLAKLPREKRKRINRIPDELFLLLSNYHFPGNIRELRSMVLGALSIHQDGADLSLDFFMQKIAQQGGQINFSRSDSHTESVAAGKIVIDFGEPFPEFDQLIERYTQEAMLRTNNNQTKAAELTGLDRLKFRRLLLGKKHEE